MAVSLSVREEFSNCYPFCHMNTSCRSWFFVFDASSSSKVTIFSRGFATILRVIRAVSGRMFGTSLPVPDKSNSLRLRGTKYSINGSAPARKKKESRNAVIMRRCLRKICAETSLQLSLLLNQWDLTN